MEDKHQSLVGEMGRRIGSRRASVSWLATVLMRYRWCGQSRVHGICLWADQWTEQTLALVSSIHLGQQVNPQPPAATVCVYAHPSIDGWWWWPSSFVRVMLMHSIHLC